MLKFFETKIDYLKGIGPQKAALLQTELGIFTYGDLIQHYPFRYEDRSSILSISDLHAGLNYVQLLGKIVNLEIIGEGKSTRLVAQLRDKTGVIELIWFQNIKRIQRLVLLNNEYLVFGKLSDFRNHYSLAHPEIEIFKGEFPSGLFPVYHITEKLKRSFVDSKFIAKIQQGFIPTCIAHINETLPDFLMTKYNLVSKKEALENIHFPKSYQLLDKAKHRLKYEELFFVQLKLLRQKSLRKTQNKGMEFKSIPTLNEFYNNHLPFELTNAQKKVIKEIYRDVCSGKQMNRLLQGDVGSGKTMVAFLCMLMAIDNGAQACLMAPTEILAEQHYRGLSEYFDVLNITIKKLTGSTKKSERLSIHEDLISGQLKVIIGTHALLEDTVNFKNLGLCVIDEQHRFGVAQRSKLWNKNSQIYPHILVMTATPIPRTLAMTLYGDLDISVIDELPVGRKPIQTLHKYDNDRLRVFGFLRKQIEEGRQIYIVYPLIEESEKSDMKDLMDGYESISRYFPEYAISIVHGKMKSKDKDFEMQRFVKGETKIMVATTVIEVGVNVPNASVMVIENSERFGLSQLHQLRGRVGRGASQSYCILLTSYKISKESKVRIETMIRTNNGFEIADVDLKLRGPGDLAGTQQSGALDLLIADLSQDAEILKQARADVNAILERDPLLENPEHANIQMQISTISAQSINWSRIS